MYQSDNHYYGPTKADTIRTDKNTLVKDVFRFVSLYVFIYDCWYNVSIKKMSYSNRQSE